MDRNNAEEMVDSRELDVDLATLLAVLKHGVMVVLETLLHTVVAVKLQEGESSGFLGDFVGHDAHVLGSDLLKVGFKTLLGDRVRQVAC